MPLKKDTFLLSWLTPMGSSIISVFIIFIMTQSKDSANGPCSRKFRPLSFRDTLYICPTTIRSQSPQGTFLHRIYLLSTLLSSPPVKRNLIF